MDYGYLIDMDGVIYRGSAAHPRRRPVHPRAARARHPVPLPDQQQPAHPPRRGHQAAAAGHRRRGGARLHLRHGDGPLPRPAEAAAAPRSSSARAACSRPCTSNGYAIVDHDPDYVVVGEGRTFNFEMVEAAVRMILGGAKLIATNLDPNCPTQHGHAARAAGRWWRCSRRPAGVKAFSVGKPSPVMMRAARKELGLTTDQTIDDRRHDGDRHPRRRAARIARSWCCPAGRAARTWPATPTGPT